MIMELVRHRNCVKNCNPRQVMDVKKTIQEAQTMHLNKVIVVGGVGGKTALLSSGFNKENLSLQLVMAANFLLTRPIETKRSLIFRAGGNNDQAISSHYLVRK